MNKEELARDIEDLLKFMDDHADHGTPIDLSQGEMDLIIDALIFYKEMNT